MLQEIELAHSWEVLEETQRVLLHAQNLYLQVFNDHILPFLYSNNSSSSTIRPSKPTQITDPHGANAINWSFRRNIHAAFAHSLPLQRFSKTLSYMLYDSSCKIFRIYVRHDGIQPDTTPEDARAFRQRMTDLLQGLERVGLGRENAQKAFAHAMDKLIDSFITSHYVKVDWFSKKSVVPQIRMWIRDGFCPLVELVMECLRCDPSTVQPTELQQWQEMVLGRLGRARVDNLFDFIINWDKSLGAILDIKASKGFVFDKLRSLTITCRSISKSQGPSRTLHPALHNKYRDDYFTLELRRPTS